MIILGVDSSSVTAAAAVLKDDEILYEGFINNGLTHSQTLLPLIDSTLKNAEISPKDVDLFAVTKGPGSFTGLRIGMSTVKGLASPFDTKCVGISSLEAAAYGVYLSGEYDKSYKNGIICAAMDARCNQVYNALFDVNNGEFIRLCDDRAISLDELKNELSRFNRPIILVADGAVLCYNKFCGELDCILTDEKHRFVLGSAAARLGFLYRDTAVDFDRLNPEYLRLPQAQRELKLKKQKQTE